MYNLIFNSQIRSNEIELVIEKVNSKLDKIET